MDKLFRYAVLMTFAKNGDLFYRPADGTIWLVTDDKSYPPKVQQVRKRIGLFRREPKVDLLMNVPEDGLWMKFIGTSFPEPMFSCWKRVIRLVKKLRS